MPSLGHQTGLAPPTPHQHVDVEPHRMLRFLKHGARPCSVVVRGIPRLQFARILPSVRYDLDGPQAVASGVPLDGSEAGTRRALFEGMNAQLERPGTSYVGLRHGVHLCNR